MIKTMNFNLIMWEYTDLPTFFHCVIIKMCTRVFTQKGLRGMKPVTKLMITEYAMKNVDWMGYTLMRGDMFTYHHIEKRENGGKITIENGAILCGKTAHPYLHIIEHIDPDMYQYINGILVSINRIRHIDVHLLEEIDRTLRIFEIENQGRKNAKGKSLIKDIYTERDFKSLYRH